MKILKYLIITLFLSTILYWLINPVKVASEGLQYVIETPEAIDEELSIEEMIKLKFKENYRIAYAVMMAESRGKEKAINYNNDYCKRLGRSSIDRGLFQINDCWHPEVPIECSNNSSCNIDEAYRISNNGTNWTQWSAYNNNSYLQFF